MQNKKNEHPDSVVEFVRKLADEVGEEAGAATGKVDRIPRPENAERGTWHFVFRGRSQSLGVLLLVHTQWGQSGGEQRFLQSRSHRASTNVRLPTCTLFTDKAGRGAALGFPQACKRKRTGCSLAQPDSGVLRLTRKSVIPVSYLSNWPAMYH